MIDETAAHEANKHLICSPLDELIALLALLDELPVWDDLNDEALTEFESECPTL